MAINTPPASPKSAEKELENQDNGDVRRGRSIERRGDKSSKNHSRSRSPPRLKKQNVSLPSKDTNSVDPESVRCRVFVGNLNTDKIGQEELVQHFAGFGEVIGCSLHMNFGFVQYASKEDADKAVDQTHGTFLFGKRVDVNIANERRKPQLKDRKRSRSRSSERYRSRSPMSKYDELYRRDDSLARSDHKHPRDHYEDRREDYYDNQDPLGRPKDSHGRETNPVSSTKTADCEVIAMSGDLKNYAESIQSRLQAMGIVASIMFPPPDVSVLRIVDNISRSGSLYAVVITTQNMFHKSCTLNILHGAPQEHRNMPLDDALSFVARNFNQYLSDSRNRRSASLPNRSESRVNTILTQDPYISGLLHMAAGGTALKVVEVNHLIEALIKYKNEIENKSDARMPLASKEVSSSHLQPSHHPRVSSVPTGHPPAKNSHLRAQQPSSAYSYGAPSSAPSSTGYPYYGAMSSAASGPTGSYTPATPQNDTGYPTSTYSRQISAYPNY